MWSAMWAMGNRAYPRAGGGTVPIVCRVPMRRGLSPRRRGNRLVTALEDTDIGPIPAQAGEPFPD